MLIDPPELYPRLQKALDPAYAIIAGEPLQALEVADAIRAAAVAQGYTERSIIDLLADDRGAWEAFATAAQACSLFGERSFLDLRLPTGKPGTQGAALLQRYFSQPAPDRVVLLQLPYLDKAQRNSAWFTAVQEQSVVIQTRTVPPQRLGAWIRARVEQAGMRITPDALSFLAQQIEGNLLAARQEIEKLALLDIQEIDLPTLQAQLMDMARFDLYEFANATLLGDTARALRMLRGMRESGGSELLILWVLTRDIRALIQATQRRAQGASISQAVQGVWGTSQEGLRRALNRFDLRQAWALLEQAAQVDRVIKGRSAGHLDQHLLNLTAALSGQPLHKANA